MEPQTSPQPQISSATDTGTSAKEGRLKVDAGGLPHKAKKKMLKDLLSKVKSVKMKMK